MTWHPVLISVDPNPFLFLDYFTAFWCLIFCPWINDLPQGSTYSGKLLTCPKNFVWNLVYINRVWRLKGHWDKAIIRFEIPMKLKCLLVKTAICGAQKSIEKWKGWENRKVRKMIKYYVQFYSRAALIFNASFLLYCFPL
jgi:hypothetical protein